MSGPGIRADCREAICRLSEPLAKSLRDMAGFRNVVVHGYEKVDLGIVKDVVLNRLEDLLAFVTALRERLQRS